MPRLIFWGCFCLGAASAAGNLIVGGVQPPAVGVGVLLWVLATLFGVYGEYCCQREIRFLRQVLDERLRVAKQPIPVAAEMDNVVRGC